MPIKYTDAMVAEAIAMRAAGEKQAVVHAIFGAGIESAIRRVRDRDADAELLARINALSRRQLRRKVDGLLYFILQSEGLKIGERPAAYLVPICEGRSHWKTHRRILEDFTQMNGQPL